MAPDAELAVCPFLVPVVVDRLWLYPVGAYCQRPDARTRVPARSTVLRLCSTPSYPTCAGYCASARPIPTRPADERGTP